MDVFLAGAERAEEHAVPVGEEDTVSHLAAKALALLFPACQDTLPQDVRLSVAGETLSATAPLHTTPVRAGCRVEATLQGDRFLTNLRSGTIAHHSLPAWARPLPACILAGVTHEAEALTCASPLLHRDKAFVMSVLKENGAALEHASPEMRNDADAVRVSLDGTSGNLRHASEALRGDKAFIQGAVHACWHFTLDSLSDELCNDKDIVLSVVQKYPYGVWLASEALRDDNDVMLCAVRGDGVALQAASERLRDDRDVALAAISQNIEAVRYAGPGLCADPIFCAERERLEALRSEDSADEGVADPATEEGERSSGDEGGEGEEEEEDAGDESPASEAGGCSGGAPPAKRSRSR